MAMVPSLDVTFKGEEEEHTSKIFITNLVRFKELKEIKKCVRLSMFHPHHQTLIETSDRDAYRGLNIEK